jgi:ComF family protein
MGIISDLISAFMPFRCHVCSESTSPGTVLCPRCFNRLNKSLNKPVEVFDTVCEFPVFTLSEYDSFVADVIKLIKYRPSKKLPDYFARIIRERKLLQDFFPGEKIFIPVPMHKSRLQERGFNQAEMFAQAMADAGKAHFSPALVRIRSTIPQASCSEEERLVNLDQAIELAGGLDLQSFSGKKLILVDDVATTGTTLRQCWLKLRDLRPAGIYALVLSHSFKKKDRPDNASEFDKRRKEI